MKAQNVVNTLLEQDWKTQAENPVVLFVSGVVVDGQTTLDFVQSAMNDVAAVKVDTKNVDTIDRPGEDYIVVQADIYLDKMSDERGHSVKVGTELVDKIGDHFEQATHPEQRNWSATAIYKNDKIHTRQDDEYAVNTYKKVVQRNKQEQGIHVELDDITTPWDE